MFKLLALILRLLAWKLDPPQPWITIENLSIDRTDPLANLVAAERHICNHYYGVPR